MVRKVAGQEEYHLPSMLQVPALLVQLNPVQNQWYDVLPAPYTLPNAKVYMIIVYIATTSETLECRVTADGNVYTGTAVAANDSNYYFCFPDVYATSAATVGTLINTVPGMGTQYYGTVECRSVRVEVRKTTVNGAGTLYSKVNYGRWP